MGSHPEKPLRLAILMADTPMPQTQAAFEDYGGVFTDLFRRALAPASLDSVLTISKHDIVNGDFAAAYPDLNQIDAILITGSKHNAYDHTPWINALVAFVRRVLATTAPGSTAAHPVRLLGICFGHQICGRALDAPVDVSPAGWEVSVTDVPLTSEGRAFFGKDTLNIFQMHRDAVLANPSGTIALGATDSCPVQGFLLPGRAVTVQGHPEFSATIVREILDKRHQIGILPDDLYSSGIARVDNKHDGELIARAFVTFLQS
ncbi:glutamine amidotransferase class 1 [Grosmannia clavigera kw1407]|uniref:Glutamine amidotransferase class 1 n=1 Tax=Grosmannia clavigera (strain kw1407 / UAMH 11150) TaxID=655863 RepID=F0X891_GROCL|nr:glutamine amidotransferase class 1 [Grosmannia clavigera kw1407]EFX06023.1 glutamine amidotransferase class 1 [Grosmannia clavigera kw1407]